MILMMYYKVFIKMIIERIRELREQESYNQNISPDKIINTKEYKIRKS